MMSDAFSAPVGINALIAIVDDNALVRNALSGLLRSARYHAVAFESGEELLDWDGLTQVDCIVMDIKLPGISGIETQRRLTTVGIDTPVIGISAYGDAAVRVQAAQAGMIAFFEKPVPAEDLLDRIAAVIIERQKLA